MHLTALFLLPLPLFVLTHPVIVEHETIAAHPIQNHVDPLHPIQPRCVTVRTTRSLTEPETTMRVNPHTTAPHRPSNPQNKSLISRALSILRIFNPHSTTPHSPSETNFPKYQPRILTRTLSRRDSVTISISNTFNSTTVCNSQNDAKFEVVNNAKNADITVGDNTSHTSNFHTFGNKNMLNSTGSNTGGWNTKNTGSNLTTHREPKRGVGKRDYIGWKGWFEDILMGGDYGRWEMPWRAPTPGTSKGDKPKWGSGAAPTKVASHHTSSSSLGAEPTFTQNPKPSMVPGPSWKGNKTDPYRPNHSGHGWPRPKFGNHTKNGTVQDGEEHKRDIVNLNIMGGSLNSTLARSGNNNTVEVYVMGNGANVVNVTVVWEGEGTDMKDSGNGNTVRVYIGDSNGVDMGNSTLQVVGGEEL
ncbi:uncharacterized protein LY89DRAFT_734661 [Mollisia scopiformis]|uniref:Uncharacterized protein n=1 Tax=Mollisia scopiformis TaxID=149040 RepID=A0A194X8R1_MOLSC|nr:uncharacterized protein LY89DRAFT_734661 [Mollisia scopiformis]KUJ16563.1 hypothetical protein LY89DRAFT_734661 [Mollisia scopiformis]